MTAITTEALITDPRAFGVKTATPCQRAACRILDGLPLGDLATDPDVVAFVGGPEALQALPSEHGEQPLELVYLASIRSLKTITACAAALRMSQTVDVSRLGPGEVPRVSIISLKLDVSTVAFGILCATVQASPLLSRLVIGEPTAEVLTIRHPSGRPIEIACVAGASKAAGLIARWSAGVIFDEAPRMVGAEDGVVNLDDARRAVLGRLLPGAQALYIGSPWAPFGPIYDTVQEHWRKPSADVVVLRGTGPMLNPFWWTPERCERLRARDPIAHRMDVLGEFADPESSLFSSDVLERRTRVEPLELEPDPLLSYEATMDPGTRGNSWTLTIGACTKNDGAVKHKAVALARQWTGSRLAPLSPEAVLREIAAVCAPYRVTTVRTDQWAADALQDLARRAGLWLVFETITAARKVELYEALRLALEQDEFELPPVALVREDLLKVRKRITQNGVSIELPRTADGRHADYAPALALLMACSMRPPTVPATPHDEQQRMRQEAIDKIERKRREAWRRSPRDVMRRAFGLR